LKFFQNFSIRKLLYNKNFAISLSIVVAFVFWLIISLDQNPERERSFSSVPITVSTQGTILAEQGIDAVNKDSILQSASVTVSGPNYIVSSLKTDDIKIYADLSGVSKPGTYTISLTAVKNTSKTGFSIIEVSPETIQVDFDYFDTKKFDIIARVDGVTTSDGLISDPAKVTNVDQQTIDIRGPRAEIEKIGSVVAYYKGDETLNTTKTFEGAIILYDKSGNQLDIKKYELPYEKVDISVPVFKEKVLSIVPTFSNVENDLVTDYLIDNNIISLSETKVTVFGQPDKIDSLQKVELAPIDISSVSKANFKFDNVTLYLEDGVGIRSDFSTVNVSFDLSKFAHKEITVSKNNIQYGDTLESNIKAQFKDKKIVICGPSSVVSKIDANTAKQFKLNVDLSGKVAGSETAQIYNVPYSVVYPSGIIAWEIVSADNKTIQVSLSEK